MKLAEHLKDVTDRRLKLKAISEGTAHIYNQTQNRFPRSLLEKDLKDVKRRDIEDAVMLMNAGGRSPKTIRHALSFLSSCLNDAVDNDLIPANPALRIKAPKQRTKVNRNVSDADLKRAITVAKDHPYGWLFRFALASGLRRGELLALDWGDIDFAAGTVKVSKSIVVVGNTPFVSTPKTASSNRKVTLPAAIIQEAKKLKGGDGDHIPVFKNQIGDRMSLASASTGIKALLTDANLGDQTMHSLRHTHASQLISSGCPLPAIAQRMGHTDIKTTLGIYAHAANSEDAKLATAIGNAVN